MGLEPTTFELEVQRADPFFEEVVNEIAYWKNFTAS